MNASLQKEWKEDPIKFQRAFWPHLRLYDKQREIFLSVAQNRETYVPSGNMMGKDFVAGVVALWFFIVHYRINRERNWVRIVTTSVKDEHLRVLWAEIARFIASSAIPMLAKDGGPLILNHHEIRHESEQGLKNPMNYLQGCVSAKGEGMQGHHAEHTLLIVDEASGVDDLVYDMASTWAKKMLIFGNPLPCANFFYRGVTEGDLLVGAESSEP